MKNLASAQRVEHLQKIQNAYSKCKEFSDDKVQLAMQTYEMVSAECFVFASVLMNKCPLSKSYIMKYLLCIYIQCDSDVVLCLVGGQTYPQAGCRPRTLWEWVKGETGSGRLREHRWKSSEEWATGWKTSTSTSRRDLWKALFRCLFNRGWVPGSQRETWLQGER